MAHFVAILHRNKHFKKLDPRSRKFYLNVFGLLINTTDFEVAKDIIKSMVTLATSPFEKDGSDTQIRKEFLIRSIHTHCVDQLIDSEESDNENFEYFELDDQEEFRQNNVLEEIYSKGNICEDGRDNLYFAHSCIKELKKLLSSLPLWSGIMVDAFKSPRRCASSAGVENSFKEMKQSIFEGKSHLRADFFVQKYCASLSTSLRYIKASTKCTESDNKFNITPPSQNAVEIPDGQVTGEVSDVFSLNGPDATSGKSLYDIEMNSIENWGGLAERDEKRRRRCAFSILEPQNDHDGPQKVVGLPFLTNGAKTTNGDSVIITSNTC